MISICHIKMLIKNIHKLQFILFLQFSTALHSCIIDENIKVKEVSDSMNQEQIEIEKPTEQDALGIESKGEMKNGKKTGKWIAYYPGGKKARELNYVNGLENGTDTWYYENGKLARINHYDNGERYGEWKYFSEEGKLIDHTHYKKDKPHGIWKKYYDNGTVKYEGMYNEKGDFSQWKEFNETKKIIGWGNYNELKKEGKWTNYYENGYVKSFGLIKGELEYPQELIYLDIHLYPYAYSYGGEIPFIIETTLFVQGGEWKEYDQKGNLIAKGNYKNGNKIGLWLYYDSKGKLIKSEEHKAEEINNFFSQ